MAVRQNAIDNKQEFPQAAQAALESFYVDDRLVGANSVREALHLRSQLQELFTQADSSGLQFSDVLRYRTSRRELGIWAGIVERNRWSFSSKVGA